MSRWENFGRYRLCNDDCLVAMRDIPAGSVDMVLTDIPYGVVNRKSGGLRKLDKGTADVMAIDTQSMLSEWGRLRPRTIYCFCGTEQVSLLRAGMVDLGYTTRLCVWEKTNPSPMNGELFWLSSVECCVFGRIKGAAFNEHCQSSVWRNPNGRSKIHPTEKPLALIKRLVSASTHENQIVLDHCTGSGTTGVACMNLNRRFIGIEKDATYYELAKKRIAEAANDLR